MRFDKGLKRQAQFIGVCIGLTIVGRLGGREAFEILVVDSSVNWPVPLVELTTVHQVRFVTDNMGRVAFDLPELMDRSVWLSVEGHGYEVEADGFGYRGVRVRPVAGGKALVLVRRKNLAKRLGRITGPGLFAESAKLGYRVPPENPIEPVGRDSVQNAVYGGKLYWFWGDTALSSYPLGIFNVTGAWTKLEPLATFRPPLSVYYNFFTNSVGELKPVARMPGEGPTWISAVTVLSDYAGRERLCATYWKIRPPLEPYQAGLCVWDEDADEFKPIRVLWTQKEPGEKPPMVPDGHSVVYIDRAGYKWVLFGNPFPSLKCPASFEAWQNPEKWQHVKQPKTVISPDGHVVVPQSGSIAYHPYIRKWVAIFTEKLGKPSGFGEVWYAEAPTPFGPWERLIKVLTHKNYTFYNPRIHSEWLRKDSPYLVFEGTYSMQFAERPIPTPRYDYNQILYVLDVRDLQKVSHQRHGELMEVD